MADFKRPFPNNPAPFWRSTSYHFVNYTQLMASAALPKRRTKDLSECAGTTDKEVLERQLGLDRREPIVCSLRNGMMWSIKMVQGYSEKAV